MVYKRTVVKRTNELSSQSEKVREICNRFKKGKYPFIFQRFGYFTKRLIHTMVQYQRSPTRCRIIVWMISTTHELQLNICQAHKHKICQVCMILNMKTNYHQFDCPSLFSVVFASSFYSYTPFFLSLHGTKYLNLSFYKMSQETSILFKILEYWCP